MKRFTFSAMMLVGASQAIASPVLDGAFANAGIDVLSMFGDNTEVVGACPHANGSASIVGYRTAPAQWVIARIKPNGSPDTAFSGDGLAVVASQHAIRDSGSAIACVGAGNGDPLDDRMMIAATSVPMLSPNDLMTVVRLNLDQGSLDTAFGYNGVMATDINYTLFPGNPETGEALYRGLVVRGIFPDAAGGWLVMGSLRQGDSIDPVGFIARLGGDGYLQALNAPGDSEFNVLEIQAARAGADGHVRTIVRMRRPSGIAWALMKLQTSSLVLHTVPEIGPASNDGYRLFKGRHIGGGAFIVPAVQSSVLPFASTPRLLIVRGDQVTDLALPQPAPLAGESVGASASDAAAGATSASNNHAIFAMGLTSANMDGVGYYSAVVRLGDGAGMADTIDSDYGTNGSAVFRYTKNPNDCPGSTAPPQRFANISSWGNMSLLVGNAAPECYDEGNGEFGTSQWLLAARITSSTQRLFGDGFE